MSYGKITRFIDDITRGFVFFLLAFIWVRYLSGNLWLTFMVSIVIAIAIDWIIIANKNKKQKLEGSASLNEKQVQEFTLGLLMSTKQEVLNYFNKNILTSVVIDEKFLELDNTAIVPIFDTAKVELDDFYKICSNINIKKYKKIIICAAAFDNKLVTFTKSLTSSAITLLNSSQTKNTFFENIEPINVPSLSKNKLNSFKEFALLFIDNKNVKGYIFSAIIIFLSSLFVRYKIYYLIASSVLLILALVCKLQTKKA